MIFALGLGANLDSPIQQLEGAVRELRSRLGPLTVASLYRSRPQSPIPQPVFFNTAVLGRGSRSPRELLMLAKELERGAGRLPGPALGPRPLDIDVLTCGELVVDDPDLVVPHPRLALRRFVLAPLAEIAPNLAIPPQGRSVAELLARVGQEEEVERLDWPTLG